MQFLARPRPAPLFSRQATPLPNVTVYYTGYRLYSHYRALQVGAGSLPLPAPPCPFPGSCLPFSLPLLAPVLGFRLGCPCTACALWRGAARLESVCLWPAGVGSRETQGCPAETQRSRVLEEGYSPVPRLGGQEREEGHQDAQKPPAPIQLLLPAGCHARRRAPNRSSSALLTWMRGSCGRCVTTSSGGLWQRPGAGARAGGSGRGQGLARRHGQGWGRGSI